MDRAIGFLESEFDRGQATLAENVVPMDPIRSQATLRERERRFRQLLDALPAAVYATDASGRITYYNEAALALWGQRPLLGSSEWCGSWKLFWPDGYRTINARWQSRSRRTAPCAAWRLPPNGRTERAFRSSLSRRRFMTRVVI